MLILNSFSFLEQTKHLYIGVATCARPSREIRVWMRTRSFNLKLSHFGHEQRNTRISGDFRFILQWSILDMSVRVLRTRMYVVT